MAASITIVWHGLSCFSIEAKNGDAVANLVTDPYNSEVGLKLPRNLLADVVTISHDEPPCNFIEAVKPLGDKKIFTISVPGEYEVGGLFVYGISAANGTTLYRYEVGDLSIGHLGDLGAPITDRERELLEDVDVLLVPVGDNTVLTAKQAVEVVTQLSPRIVIPMHYALPGLKTKSDTVEKFLKEMGASKSERVTKLKIMKKDLPVEETKVIIIDKE
jgi:L-ascorbate metabolism protein UlaG (beta-lactamase superfamily)